MTGTVRSSYRRVDRRGRGRHTALHGIGLPPRPRPDRPRARRRRLRARRVRAGVGAGAGAREPQALFPALANGPWLFLEAGREERLRALVEEPVSTPAYAKEAAWWAIPAVILMERLRLAGRIEPLLEPLHSDVPWVDAALDYAAGRFSEAAARLHEIGDVVTAAAAWTCAPPRPSPKPDGPRRRRSLRAPSPSSARSAPRATSAARGRCRRPELRRRRRAAAPRAPRP